MSHAKPFPRLTPTDPPPSAGGLEDTPPDHDLFAEEAVLSACLLGPLEPGACTVDALPFLHPEHFYAAAHRSIYEAILSISRAGNAVDAVTVSNWLRAAGKLAAIGGIPYLAKITDSTPAVAHVADHARIIYESAQVRYLENECRKIAAECRAARGERRERLDKAEQRIGRITQAGVHAADGEMFGSAMRARIKQIEDRARSGTWDDLTPTGFRALDELAGGFGREQVWILAAPPGGGKTALAINIALNVASDETTADGTVTKPGGGVAFFSLEMTRTELVDRVLCSEGRVLADHLKHGRLTLADWAAFTEASQWLDHTPLWIEDTKGLTVFDIRSKAIRQKGVFERAGRALRLVVVDYLQIVASASGKHGNREQEVAETSRELKRLAGVLKCPVLALAQISKDAEKNKRRPLLGDLRESGAIANDADFVGFLWADSDTPRGCRDLIVAKQRSGAVGSVRLAWRPEITRFEDWNEGAVPPREWGIGSDLGGAS